MAFTTLQFIIFFVVVFFGYYAVSARCQWWLLLGASWFFYAFASPVYLIFLGLTTVTTYLAAVGMDVNLRHQKAWVAERGKTLDRNEKKSYKAMMEGKRRLMVAAVVVVLIGMLIVFKYLGFLSKNISWLAGIFGAEFAIPHVNLILPIGLSFYVFQSLGYCVDVSREVVAAERNFFRHALFVSYFPQILQGPIGDYGRLGPQLFGGHAFDYERVVAGLQRVAWGFFKKLMVANVIANRIDPVWQSAGYYPGFIFWFAVLVLYSIQLYADFSGYMDIACGCSQMLGIKLDENFNCPYFAKNIAEFWRKWHITLGTWFKNYVFYPLLRNEALTNMRKRFKGNDYLAGTLPTLAALLVVWLLIGLWHGADWAYVFYGLFHGSFIMLSIALAPLYGKLHGAFPRCVGGKVYAFFQIVRTFLIVTVGYSIFKPADLDVTVQIWRQMVGTLDGGGVHELIHTLQHSFLWAFLWMGFMMLVDVIHMKHGNGYIRGCIRKFPLFVRWVIYGLGLWLLVYKGLYGSGFDQFEYFKF